MQLCLLHLDDALHLQPDFIQSCQKEGARQIDARHEASKIRLWGNHQQLDHFGERLRQEFSSDKAMARICFLGSGDFHHVTPYLLASALKNTPEPATVIHFDNHPDWVKFDRGMHCGSWVNQALENPQIRKIITVGVCSQDLNFPEWKGANLSLLSKGLLELYPYDRKVTKVRGDYGANASYMSREGALHWKSIASIGEQNFIEHLLSRIKTRAVYMTIDKDVLAREDAITNWDQGKMRLPLLLSIIKAIARHHSIIGADVTGDYSVPTYEGSTLTKLLKHAEIFIDQPRKQPPAQQRQSINSAANHALLKTFAEVMA